MSKKAVFLDRDGVINDSTRPVNKPQDLIIFPWAASSIRRLNEEGYMVFVVTNQGGIELGYMSEADLNSVHLHMEKVLKRQDAQIDETVYCPHFRQRCSCRKPQPGMILSLAEKHGIDLNSSWMIGDRAPDIQAGSAAGCRTIKLGRPDPHADYVCRQLDQAVDYILTH